jgi:hypothetical protein
MTQPTPSDVHVNAPLTSIAVAYLQDLRDFVADRVFPLVPVQKQSDRYFLFPKGNWFRSEAKPRGLSQESAGSGFEIDNTPNYFAEVQAVHKDIDDRLRANADAPLDLDAASSEFVTRQLMIRKEKDWAAKYFTTGVWTGSSTGGDITPGTLWSAPGSTPIADIRGEIRAVKKNTGYFPTKLVLGDKVWQTLQDHPDFVDRIKFSAAISPTEGAKVTPRLLAALLELEEVLIASAVENSAAEGAADSLAFIADSKDALLVYAAPRPSIMAPSAGYTFAWTGYLGATRQGMRMLRMRMDHLRSDRIEGEVAYDQKVVASDLGVFFNNAVA